MAFGTTVPAGRVLHAARSNKLVPLDENAAASHTVVLSEESSRVAPVNRPPNPTAQASFSTIEVTITGTGGVTTSLRATSHYGAFSEPTVTTFQSGGDRGEDPQEAVVNNNASSGPATAQAGSIGSSPVALQGHRDGLMQRGNEPAVSPVSGSVGPMMQSVPALRLHSHSTTNSSTPPATRSGAAALPLTQNTARPVFHHRAASEGAGSGMPVPMLRAASQPNIMASAVGSADRDGPSTLLPATASVAVMPAVAGGAGAVTSMTSRHATVRRNHHHHHASTGDAGGITTRSRLVSHEALVVDALQVRIFICFF